MAPHQKCSLTCTWGSFASNYRAVKMCWYLTWARKTCKSSKKQGLVVKMDGVCSKQTLLWLPVYRAQKWPQCSRTTGYIWVEMYDWLYMKRNMTSPSKFTILSGEEAKKQKKPQKNTMANIDDEEHKCIKIICDGWSAFRNPPVWF